MLIGKTPSLQLEVPILELDLQHALQDAVSSEIMQQCMHKSQSAKQISQETGIPAVTVYRHAKRLLGQHLLVIERSAITESGKPYDLFRCPMEWAGILISPEGMRVRWKSRQAVGDRIQSMWKQLEERK